MSACEWCWAAASRQAFHSGASVAEMYRLILKEQEMLGKDAACPSAQRMAEGRPLA